MKFHVTYSLSNGKEVLQKFDNATSSEVLAKHIEGVIGTEGFHKVSPGYYGTIFGETYIKASEIVSYHISKG